MRHAVEGHRTLRRKRLERLRAQSPGIEAALAAYSRLPTDQLYEVRVREGFIASARPRDGAMKAEHFGADPWSVQAVSDAADSGATSPHAEDEPTGINTRTPLARLIHRRSRALALYSTILFVLHAESAAGLRVQNRHGTTTADPNQQAQDSWARLAGMGHANVRARRARAVRAIAELNTVGLIRLSSDALRPFDGFTTLREDATEKGYTVPGDTHRASLRLPGWLFLQGWHLVLEPREWATLLVLTHAGIGQHLAENGFPLMPDRRRTAYLLSDECYESIHELQEFGLIKIIDLMPGRRYGRVNPVRGRRADVEDHDLPILPYRFQLRTNTGPPRRNALDQVIRCLQNSSAPPRFR